MAAPPMAAPEQYDIAKSPEAPPAAPAAAQPSTKATKRAADDMGAADPGLAIAADGNPFELRRELNTVLKKIAAKFDEQEAINARVAKALPVVERLDEFAAEIHAWRDRLEGDLGPTAILRHEVQGVAAAVEKAVGDTRTVLVRVHEHRANVEGELAAKTLELRAKIESMETGIFAVVQQAAKDAVEHEAKALGKQHVIPTKFGSVQLAAGGPSAAMPGGPHTAAGPSASQFNIVSANVAQLQRAVEEFKGWAEEKDDQLVALMLDAGRCHCDHVEQLIEGQRLLRDGAAATTAHIRQNISPEMRRYGETLKKHEEALRAMIGDAWMPSMVATTAATMAGASGVPGLPYISSSIDNTAKNLGNNHSHSVHMTQSPGGQAPGGAGNFPGGAGGGSGGSGGSPNGWPGAGGVGVGNFGTPPGIGQQVSPGTTTSRIDKYSRVYDIKVAQQPENQYNGSRTDGSGPIWYEWTRNYLVGQAPDVEPLLQWAESQESRKISNEEVEVLLQNPGFSGMDAGAPAPSILSGHVWQYLNAALVKNAAEIFRNLQTRNGLEAWRRIFRWIYSGSAVQRRTLKKRVDNPIPAKDVGQIGMAIEN